MIRNTPVPFLENPVIRLGMLAQRWLLASAHWHPAKLTGQLEMARVVPPLRLLETIADAAKVLRSVPLETRKQPFGKLPTYVQDQSERLAFAAAALGRAWADGRVESGILEGEGFQTIARAFSELSKHQLRLSGPTD